ncbi:MAG: glycoside hydrolase family 95 protein [Chitinophagaceae bacterium]|nr:MAG: glycoside hydrolase family 95 protein [Chitinophagaceae bacterium]
MIKKATMKKVVILIFPLIILTLATHAQQSLRLWYNKPAQNWEETLPLGNGRLGMMPNGGVKEENIILNDITLWSGSPYDANNHEAYKKLPEIRKLLLEGKNEQAQEMANKYFICSGPGSGDPRYGCYQVLGSLHLYFAYNNIDSNHLKFTGYNRSLSLNDAIASCAYQINGVTYKRECFTSFDDDVDVIKLGAGSPGRLNCKISLDRPERSSVFTKNDLLEMSGQLDNGVDGKGMKYLVKVKVKLKGGSLQANEKTLDIQHATEAVIYISAGTNYHDPVFETKIDEALRKAEQKSYALERSDHIKNYRALFDRVKLNLGKPVADDLSTNRRLTDFEKDPSGDNGLPVLFFQYGRYLSISSTRPGLLPPNLQGLWANQIHTPWNGDYHLDVNVEMDNWQNDVTNLAELDEPLVKLVSGLVKNGERTAKSYFDTTGWVAHVITNVWGYTAPGESASWGIPLSGSGWLCDNLWKHYAFTNNKSYLKKIYPVLRGAALFYNNILIRDTQTGWLVTSPSSSPENSFYLPNGKTANVCMGPTIDNQIVRELFAHVIEASEWLNVDKDFRDTLENKLRQLPPPGEISKDGSLMEWLRDFKQTDLHHRHISHLYGLFPASLITPEKTPLLAQACKKTLQMRGDDGPGWSIAYKMLWWARLHDGAMAYKLFRDLMRPVTSTQINYGAGGGVYPNLLSAGPPFQIDGNFGGTAGIAEMLVQSQNGLIQFLPAIPAQWSRGSYSGLCVRGGGVVSAIWKNHKLQSISLKAKTANSFHVKLPDGTKYTVTIDKRSVHIPSSDGIIDLPLKKGQTAHVVFE